MDKIKKFNEFVDGETLNEKTSTREIPNMLYEMASVGYFTTFKKNGKPESPKFKVFVCGDEGEIPHMHIWDDETDGKKMHTCVCLNKIEYFHHTGKEDILTPKQKKYKEDISLVGKFYWTVCSDAIERLYEKHGGIKIPNEYLELFIDKYKSLSDDGYHFSIEVPDGDGEMESVEKVIVGLNSKETFEHIKNKNDERIMKYINRITNVTVKESVYVKNLSKEDYYTEVVYVFYEDRVDGFQDYSIETMNILKEAVEYLRRFVELNKNNKDIDIRKYSTAVWNGDDLIGTATIMDIHSYTIKNPDMQFSTLNAGGRQIISRL